MMNNLVCEYFAGSDVVAITETTWDNEDLKFIEQIRIFDNPVHVQSLRRCAGKLKCMLRFKVAINSCRSYY